MASLKLEAFIDETIQVSRDHGYHPTTFISMRERYGTVEAISKLVVNGDIQSGFKRLESLGLLDISVESAVCRFSNEFRSDILAAAEWRLSQARGEHSNT